MITQETRLESYIITNPKSIRDNILNILDRPMTARQIADKLGYSHPIIVRPRITELMKQGKIKATDKAYDEVTQRNVAVFTRI